MINAKTQLPNDIKACHDIITQMTAMNEALKTSLRLANIRLYGQSSEQSKFLELMEKEVNDKLAYFIEQEGKIQGELFTDIIGELKALQAEIEANKSPEANAEESLDSGEKGASKTPRKKKSKHMANLGHLTHVDCHHGNEIKECPNCKSEDLHAMGTEITRELEIIPAQIIVKNHITHKFVCKKCTRITNGQKPQSPLNKCIAGPGLLAYILHSRYSLFIPYYRMSKDFLGYGLEISEANLCNWTGATAHDILYPLYLEIKKIVLSVEVVYGDETTIRELAKGKCIIKYFWCYSDKKSKYSVFDYSSRKRENPSDFLADFKNGYLITDQYGGYNEICKRNNLKRGYCWVHGRRKFYEIIVGSDDPNDLKGVKYIFKLINEMLEIDAGIRDGDYDKIIEQRQEKVAPLIDTIYQNLELMRSNNPLMPKNLLNAIDYFLKYPAEFKTFLLHPDIEPTNNYSEQRVRHITIGRNNWLFTGNERGGKTTAIITTIVTCAKAHELDPRSYLTYLIQELPKAKQSELHKFLPQNCPQFKADKKTEIKLD